MSNGSYNYTPLLQEDEAQPPPYTPSEVPSSSYAGSSSLHSPSAPNQVAPAQHSAGLYPMLQYAGQSYQYQQPLAPPPQQQQYQQYQQYQSQPQPQQQQCQYQYQQQCQPQYMQPQQQPQSQCRLPSSQTHCLSPPQQVMRSTPSTPMLMRPPSKIEDLKTKPDVVVCQHCHHLVLTEISCQP
ncbi:hypothetical protein BGX21_004173, partial [Mortierella sp. AD011]